VAAVVLMGRAHGHRVVPPPRLPRPRRAGELIDDALAGVDQQEAARPALDRSPAAVTSSPGRPPGPPGPPA